jgi:adenylate cyclase
MGVVVLSQYVDPEHAVNLLGEGAAGCAYMLKDGVAEGNQLAAAVRQVASGGSMLDPKIVNAERLDPLRVKGRDAPVNAYVITVAGADGAIPRVAGTGGTP